MISSEVGHTLRINGIIKQTLAILEANPRTEGTALKIRECLLQQEKFVEFLPMLFKAYAQMLFHDELLAAVSVLCAGNSGIVGSEILVLPPYREKGLGKKLLTDKIKWYRESYPDLPFKTKVACDNMASINMCLAVGLTVARCIEATKRNGETFHQLVFTV